MMKVNNNCKLKSLCRNPLTERLFTRPPHGLFLRVPWKLPSPPIEFSFSVYRFISTSNTISRFLSHFVTSAGIHLESCKNKCFKVNDAMLRVLPNETSWRSFPYFCVACRLIHIYFQKLNINSFHIWDFKVAVSSKVIYWNFQYLWKYQNKKNKIILTIFKFIRFIGSYIYT